MGLPEMERGLSVTYSILLRGDFQGIDTSTRLSFSMVGYRKAASYRPDQIIVAPPRPSVSTSGSLVIRSRSAASAN